MDPSKELLSPKNMISVKIDPMFKNINLTKHIRVES